jgi:endogenous inhibitor of DNA gyrase (YacG/DUF329 family)
MIMPCINSTLAGEAGGSFAVVEEGNRLLGWPGAPGWTTTGRGPFCCARAEQSIPTKTANAGARRSLRCRSARLGKWPNGLKKVPMKTCTK